MRITVLRERSWKKIICTWRRRWRSGWDLIACYIHFFFNKINYIWNWELNLQPIPNPSTTLTPCHLFPSSVCRCSRWTTIKCICSRCTLTYVRIYVVLHGSQGVSKSIKLILSMPNKIMPVHTKKCSWIV